MVKMPLYKQIQSYYRERILTGELRYKDRVPSEQEIMEEFRVSKITVKNALISLAEEGLITRIQGKGTFVAQVNDEALSVKSELQSGSPAEGMNNIIGFIIPTLKTKVIQKLVDYVELHAKEAGYQTILHITRESSVEESKAINKLTEIGVKGIIVFPTEDEKYNESLLRLSLDKFPFVFIDRYLRNIDTYQIISDNEAGSYETINYLLSKGHQNIALISPDNTNTAIEDRTLGFEKAYIDKRISIDKTLWCHVPLDILRTDRAEPYVTAFLSLHPEVSAIYALSAETAQIAYQSLGKLDRRETEIVSFDNPDLPGISYVSQNENLLAQAAVTLLKSQIEGEYLPQQTVIEVELILCEQLP
ncbi:GntR family transcriptional regulator [Paenibacillus algorifonticola]|uniref:GntR family transcriptional regulator n=1 Tax=Paenibacillus algorifonticola TaxID=684063 RepID=UPI003D26C092